MTRKIRVIVRIAIGLALLLPPAHRANPCEHRPKPPGNAGNARRLEKPCRPA